MKPSSSRSRATPVVSAGAADRSSGRMPRMKTFVALLRGVNVGGRTRVPMAELREALAEVGYEEVTTYIQSGNVVLRAPDGAKAVAAAVEKRIRADFGVEVTVIVRTHAQLRRMAAASPFGSDHVHVAFLSARPAAKAVDALDPARGLPDEF